MDDTLIVCHSLDSLAPQVAQKAQAAIDAAIAAGYNIRAFETLRSAARQDFLYKKGRDIPGRIVTNQPAWKSWHQYGVALDVAFWANGTWSWAGNFSSVSKFFMEEGFKWLYPFEEVHFQLTAGWDIERAHTFLQTSTLQGLWAEMGLS